MTSPANTTALAYAQAEHQRAERLHEALRRVMGLATQAVNGRVPADAVLLQIQDVAKEAIRA